VTTTTTAAAVRHGGVVFRVRDDLFFLPASIAMKVMPTPVMARVPGSPSELRGVALVDGDMIPVVQLGEPENLTWSGALKASGFESGAMLVCVVLGEQLGLVGIDIVATGSFEEVTPSTAHAGPVVKMGDEQALPFDVAEVIARVREGRWAV
jgi:chemotaxis signal transduction protein